MLTDRLKLYTKEAHVSVERLIVQKIQTIRTTEDYINLLKMFYGYFSALEEKIKPVINTGKLPDYAERRKSDVLLSDISIAGGTAGGPANDLPEITSHQQALGAMYVMEGSTLGGQVISSMIGKKLGERSADALRFFKGYGEQTHSKWESFKNSLNDSSASENDISLTLSAALGTFEKFKKWIERYESNEEL